MLLALLTDKSKEEFVKRCGGNVDDCPEFTETKAAAVYQKNKGSKTVEGDITGGCVR